MRRRPALLLPALPWLATATLSPPAAAATPAPPGHGAPAAAAPPRIVPRALAFPRDFGAHPEFRIEWWYATGALRSRDDPRAPPEYGFQLTFFRSRVGAAGAQPGAPGRFAPRQLLFAHAAVTDLRARRLRHAQRIARWNGEPGAAPAAAALADTRVHLGPWWLERTGPPARSRYRARLGDADAGFAYELELAATQPLLLQGQAGLSRKGPDPEQASHYYTQPQLAVTGTLQLGAIRRPVHGRAWLDHEWSETLLHPEAVGWDWIGINLDDGGALTAFQLRRADGSAVWVGGSFRPAGGEVQDFAPHALRFAAGRRWTSPATQARYPVQWRIATPAGSVDVEALLDAQELDSRATTGAIYWEGLSELRDPTGRRIGLGYLEMTGYAAPLRL
jgi:predicted secreted hydrolase